MRTCGQIEGHVLPSGAVVRYTYRADGRMLTIRVNGVEIVRQIDYQAFSEPKSWGYGNAGQYQRTFDLDGRIKEHRAGPATRAIRFDTASRIREIDDGPTGANRWTFGYDALDRLETAINVGTQGAIADLSVAWEYDPTGNRTSQTLGANPTVPYITEPTSNKLTSVNAVPRQYDAVGNTNNDGAGFTSIYNARNRLVHIANVALGRCLAAQINSTNSSIAFYHGVKGSGDNRDSVRYFYSNDDRFMDLTSLGQLALLDWSKVIENAGCG